MHTQKYKKKKKRSKLTEISKGKNMAKQVQNMRDSVERGKCWEKVSHMPHWWKIVKRSCCRIPDKPNDVWNDGHFNCRWRKAHINVERMIIQLPLKSRPFATSNMANSSNLQPNYLACLKAQLICCLAFWQALICNWCGLWIAAQYTTSQRHLLQMSEFMLKLILKFSQAYEYAIYSVDI